MFKLDSSLWRNLAFLMPNKLVYWCVVRALAFTSGQKEFSKVEVGKITGMEVMAIWEHYNINEYSNAK